MKKLSTYINNFFDDDLPSHRAYGHNYILRQYTKVNLPYKIPGKLTHGWSAESGINGGRERYDAEQRRKKTFFVWNRNNLRLAKKLGFKKVYAIGAPFIYLPKKENKNADCREKNLLLFPLHTWEIEAIKVYSDYIRRIEKISKNFKDISVCLFWVEHQNKKIKDVFKRTGWRVITLGPIDRNPNFLEKFRNLVNKFNYISSNIFSSAVFYSLYMKKKVFIYGGLPSLEVTGKDPKKYFCGHLQTAKNYPNLLWKNFNDRSHFDIGAKELGLEYKRKPNELKELFGWTPGRYWKQRFFRLGDYLQHIYSRAITNKAKERNYKKIC